MIPKKIQFINNPLGFIKYIGEIKNEKVTCKKCSIQRDL